MKATHGLFAGYNDHSKVHQGWRLQDDTSPEEDEDEAGYFTPPMEKKIAITPPSPTVSAVSSASSTPPSPL